MKKDEFRDCEFIEQSLKFYGFKDFCDNAFIIKRNFNSLSRNGKIFYKYYIYASININLKQKHAIWDYLNDYTDFAQLHKIYNR